MKSLKAKTIIFVVLLQCTLHAGAQTLAWYDPMEAPWPCVNGRGWDSELQGTYTRLPNRMQKNMPEKVWKLSQNAAGLTLRFTTNSRTLQVKYTIANAPQLPNMSRLNQAGIDLYATNKSGHTHWIGNHMQWNWGSDTISFAFRELETGEGTYELYLPPYSTLTSLKIGVEKEAIFNFCPVRTDSPIVIYGSSIVQGASPSRPGLMWTNILRRQTGYNIVNMGFSGSCLMEPELFKALSEIDAKLFIIDPIPNSYRLTDEEIIKRITQGVHQLRRKSNAPILLSESYPQPDITFNPHAEDRMRSANKALRKAYESLLKAGMKGVYYQNSQEIGFTEDAMIEASHPNDIGNMAYAKAYEKKLKEILH